MEVRVTRLSVISWGRALALVLTSDLAFNNRSQRPMVLFGPNTAP